MSADTTSSTSGSSGSSEKTSGPTPGITVRDQGPYYVRGIGQGVRLVRRRPVTDADGHPTGWEDVEDIDLEGHVDSDGVVHLCRCGHSRHKPFCDNSHRHAKWDGTENAPEQRYDALAEVRADNGIEMGDAAPLCTHTGFCVRKSGDVWQKLGQDLDDAGRAELEQMIELCPSGRLTHRDAGEPSWEEPDLPTEIVCVVDGQYLVTGGIPIERADGKPFQTRNRESLCRCGESSTKPLCDGTHFRIDFSDEMIVDSATEED